jgi:hypothetical protein
MAEVPSLLIPAETGAIRRACRPLVDADAVVRWAESVKFDAMLLDRVLDGGIAISTFGPPLPWKRLWRLELFQASMGWFGLSRHQFLHLRRAGASDGDLRWADYTKRGEFLLHDILTGKRRIVGVADDGGWEFEWTPRAPMPIQLYLFDDIGGWRGWQWRTFSPAESRAIH